MPCDRCGWHNNHSKICPSKVMSRQVMLFHTLHNNGVSIVDALAAVKVRKLENPEVDYSETRTRKEWEVLDDAL